LVVARDEGDLAVVDEEVRAGGTDGAVVATEKDELVGVLLLERRWRKPLISRTKGRDAKREGAPGKPPEPDSVPHRQ
jgi:hypothetical protein